MPKFFVTRLRCYLMRLFYGRIALLLFFLGGSAAGSQAQVINMAVPNRSVAQVAYYAALERGYYREEGLEVRLIVMSAPLTVNAILAANVEFSGATGAALPASVGGAPLRFLFASFHKPMFWLFAKPEVRDIQSLKGRRVAISGVGSGPAMLLMELLKRNGLEGGRDVVLLSMGVTPARYGALLSGSVDAAILVPPLSFMAEAAGYRQLVSFIEQEFIELTGAVIARQGLLQSDPALAEKFVRATVKGLRLARENRSAAISFLMRHTKTTEELAAKVYDICRPGMTNDGTVEESVQRRVLETAARNRGLQEIPSNDRVFDFSMAKKVNAQLDSKKWRPQ